MKNPIDVSQLLAVFQMYNKLKVSAFIAICTDWKAGNISRYLSITANYTKQWEKWWKNPEQVRMLIFFPICLSHNIIDHQHHYHHYHHYHHPHCIVIIIIIIIILIALSSSSLSSSLHCHHHYHPHCIVIIIIILIAL